MQYAARRFSALASVVALLLAGCAPSADESPTSSESVAPSTSPASTSPPPSTPTSRAVPLTLYYVALGDNGASGELLGCGDSLVPITTGPITTDDVLRASMERLLSDPDRDVGSGLSSALPGGTLSYVDGTVDGETVTVELTGHPAPAGECDNPRIEAQLERTAMAATDASEAVVLVDGVPIEDVLSLK